MTCSVTKAKAEQQLSLNVVWGTTVRTLGIPASPLLAAYAFLHHSLFLPSLANCAFSLLACFSGVLHDQCCARISYCMVVDLLLFLNSGLTHFFLSCTKSANLLLDKTRKDHMELLLCINFIPSSALSLGRTEFFSEEFES